MALLAGAVVAGVAIGEIIEAAAVAVVLVVNALVGFVTELRATRSMEALRRLTSAVATVERHDRRDEVEAAEFVPGDMVTMEAGDRVPADVRLVEAADVQAEESALTGESIAVGKHTARVAEDTPLAERANMAYMATTVRAGRARGVVVATGTRTEVGRISELAEATEAGRAPLQAGLERLGRTLSLVVLGVAVVLAGLGLARGFDTREVLEVSIALGVAIVPEGLPAVATLTLTVGMRRMASAHVLVGRLSVVETLGSATVIAADKTGTLTANEMRVTCVQLVDGVDELDLWISGVVCNDADTDPDGEPVGDPTEVALLRGAADAGLDWRQIREHHPRQDEVPFDPATKRMAVVADGAVHVKGAPEVVLQAADDRLLAAAEDMATHGLRTLAVAAGRAPHDTTDHDHLFAAVQPIGVVGVSDPPRSAAVDAVRMCHEAGIRVVMITGDQPRTAIAVARELATGRSCHQRDRARPARRQ